MPDLSVEMCGLNFKNPFILSSATPTKTAKNIKKGIDSGWAGAVMKMLSPYEHTRVYPRPRFKLYWLKDQGGYPEIIPRSFVVTDIEEASHLSPEDYVKELNDAKKWLTSLHGVGPKTAAIVLLFSFGRPALPVDTHVHRVTKRLGLIDERTTREKAHPLLEAIIPKRCVYSLNYNLVRHGRSICRSQRPLCSSDQICPYPELLIPSALIERTRSMSVACSPLSVVTNSPMNSESIFPF